MSDTPSDLTSYNLSFVEELYKQYLANPSAVSPQWRAFFDEQRAEAAEDAIESQPAPTRLALGPAVSGTQSTASANGHDLPLPQLPSRCAICGREMEIAALQHRVDKLIRNYRVRGHRVARLDPLGLPRPQQQELDPEYNGFTEADMDLRFAAGTLSPDGGPATLREILYRLRTTYCRSIGVQYMHIDNLSMREWLQERMEGSLNRLTLSRDEQVRILTRLTDAEIFEDFIQKKFIGAKRFSLEGAESLIPLLDLAIERAGAQGIEEIVVAMAHRGRLNVLANIMGKSPRLIFQEFADVNAEDKAGRGDVKYHLGYHSDWETSSGRPVHLALCFNPSHLEFVNPVALGRVRAKQDRLGDFDRERGMAVLIHGDAAFAGEGIVQETLNLSELRPYTTGGSLHIVVNNQIGFTTTPREGRSSYYATDVAKMLQIPIFHVNGEDPEAVAQVVGMAMEFRKTFKRDVVIDMYSFRRRGHNEGDEPSFTQPVMYRAIEQRKSVRDSYLDRLLKMGEVDQAVADRIAEDRRAVLEDELSASQEASRPTPTYRPSILGRIWRNYRGGYDTDVEDVDTGVPLDRLGKLLDGAARVPEGFNIHPKIERLLKARRDMAAGERPLDWAAGEALAFATLATEGARIRMTGQDCERGTFSHRHAVLHDYEDGHRYMPLAHLEDGQAPVEIYNSPLSEVGVLGFEYGFSIAYPDGLTLWEAQFGDFVNVAQVIIDQGIASAEDKWNSLSGIVLLLPHGFEGMGPEHSSARLERFLTLAAEDNIQVAYPTTPAQYYHLLRRQVLRPWRKPLVVMTPKSMLRLPQATSALEDLAQGRFERILPDARGVQGSVDRVLLCSGKVYYDLEKEREQRERDDVAIIRLEQLYPLRDRMLTDVLSAYPEGTPVVWVQEEPRNMGAWTFLRAQFGTELYGRWPFYGVSRPASASPATGSAGSHKLEQERLLEEAFSVRLFGSSAIPHPEDVAAK